MREEPGAISTAARAGLVAGPVALAAILAGPLLDGLPTVLRTWGGGGLVLSAVLVALVRRGQPGRRRRAGVLGGVVTVGAVLLLAGPLAGMPPDARRVLAAAALMAIWWITVAIPIPATSLLPLVLFPVLGVLPSGATAVNYANNNVFLFLGGFVLALGIQRWGLHRRIALTIVHAVGTNPSRMVLGFMIATAFLSMWISNTATALMMLPIALAVIAAMTETGGGDATRGLAPALLLGVAYSASIGGLATPIGTPPNISFLRILEILYPEAPSFSFGRWTLALLPLLLVFLPVAWLLLTRVIHRLPTGRIDRAERLIDRALAKLGPMGRAERRMLFIFAATAVLWLSRGDLDLGSVRIPGWASLLEGAIGAPFAAGNLHDATVAVAMAIVAFLVPGEPDAEGRPRRLMDWQTARQLPWGILLLFGGGFALASAFKESGLSLYLGESFAGSIGGAGPVTLVASTSLLMTFLTELTSNTATTEVSLPVLGGAAGALGVNPLLLMLPATLSASCAFMLPIATPPNAIVFGSGQLEMREMVRAGLVLNLVGVALITALVLLVAGPLLGVDLSTVPTWAQ